MAMVLVLIESVYAYAYIKLSMGCSEPCADADLRRKTYFKALFEEPNSLIGP